MDDTEHLAREAAITALKSMMVATLAIVCFFFGTYWHIAGIFLALVCALGAFVLGIKSFRLRRKADDDSMLPMLALLQGTVLVGFVGWLALVGASLGSMH